MDEVDYTRFYYRPAQASPPPQRPEKPERPRPPKRTHKVLWGIVAVVLCFAILFLCADFFGKGFLISRIGSFFGKTTYSYYLTVSSYPTRDTAYAQSLSSEENGGAGYTFADDGKYLVALSAYLSETDAKSVAAKNGVAYYVYTLSYQTKDTDTANLIDEFVRETDKCIYKSESGVLTENELSVLLSGFSEKFKSLAEKKSSEKEKSSRDLCLFAADSVTSVTADIVNRKKLLFKLRYCVCCILFSARSVFGVA